MTSYEENAASELRFWQLRMQKRPSFFDSLSKRLQEKVNSFIPEKVHASITVAIEKMVKGVIFGAKHTSSAALTEGSLIYREAHVKRKIERYRTTATTEGALTGAGGFFWGLADFPLLIGIKLKLLFEIAGLYGFNVKDYRERLFILYVFQLAFSSQKRRNEVYHILETWAEFSERLPQREEDFDWRTFQQEYRDYIDLAKMAQLVPVIGAAVGAVANYRLINLLGETAMNCYRMRLLNRRQLAE